MKKIFTLILCLAAFVGTAGAQILVTQDGTTDADEFTFYAEKVEMGPGFSLLLCEPNEPYIVNQGTEDVELTVTVNKTNPEVDELTWCGILTTCTPIRDNSETRSKTLQPGEQAALALHADFHEGQYATYRAEVVITAGKTTRTIYVNFIYNEKVDGISNVAGDGQISLANKSLSYRFGTQAARTLEIYSVSGRLVKKAELSGNGSLSLAGLPKGVYIYRLTTDGRRTVARKFILK